MQRNNTINDSEQKDFQNESIHLDPPPPRSPRLNPIPSPIDLEKIALALPVLTDFRLGPSLFVQESKNSDPQKSSKPATDTNVTSSTNIFVKPISTTTIGLSRYLPYRSLFHKAIDVRVPPNQPNLSEVNKLAACVMMVKTK